MPACPPGTPHITERGATIQRQRGVIPGLKLNELQLPQWTLGLPLRT